MGKDNGRALESIAAEINVCHLCPLASGRTLAVPGEGPVNAGVMLVGEAPGREEDLTGRPFVGRAGKLLDSALQKAGISRSEVFITSVVKCRPPRNRKPKARESNICVDTHLRRQLDAIEPKLVVLLGRTAVEALLGESSLKSVRGRLLVRRQRRFLSTYHPAAVLRNPHLRPALLRDLRRIKKA